jgi:hypothetical protein
MPFRLDPEKYGEFRAKIQFTTGAWMPYLIYRACMKTGILSNTRYCQIAVTEKLARDLEMDLDELLSKLPKARSSAAHLWNPDGTLPGRRGVTSPKGFNLYESGQHVTRYGMGNTIEEID